MHTWLGRKEKGGDVFMICTTTTYYEDAWYRYIPWFKKNNGQQVYLRIDSTLYFKRQDFKKYIRNKKHFEVSFVGKEQYITINQLDLRHIKAFPRDIWNKIFDEAKQLREV